MNHKGIAITLAGLMLTPSMAAAELALGAKLGTLGAGVELSKDLTSNINARIGLNTLTLDESGTEDDIDYDIDLDLNSVTVLFDWHPFAGGMRVSAGAAFNDNELVMVGKANQNYTIGNTTYTPAQVGTLRGTVTFDDLTPYLGIGWGNAVSPDDRLTVSVDVGVLFQGSPEARLTADGLLASDPGFQSDLAQEEQNLNDDLDEFELYPVLALGIAYRF